MQALKPIDQQPKVEPSPAPLRSITDIIADLSKPIPERHIKTRTQGGKQISYISWDTAVRYLDHFAPGWSFEVRNVIATPERCVVVAPTGKETPFSVDALLREGMLKGLDQIELTRARESQIAAFQVRDRERRPWLYPSGLGPRS